MGRKCPKGIIWVQPIFLFVFILGIVIYLWQKQSNTIIVEQNNHVNASWFQRFFRPNIPYSNDILSNPYSEPLRDDRYLVASRDIRGVVPINVATQSVDTNYRQVGILTRTRDETILPLMGRPLIVHRDKWNFYCMNDKNNAIKLPIVHNNKRCTGQNGCVNLYDGDIVYVEGYKETFRVTMYDNNVIQYIPY